MIGGYTDEDTDKNMNSLTIFSVDVGSHDINTE